MNSASAQSAATVDALVRIRGLKTVLGGKTIFDGVDLDIPRGSVTAVMGPSGTGKTTLLRHITGQLKPDAGEVLVDGHDVVRLPRAELFDLRERIGYLFQNSALLTDFTVFENVAFPLRQHLRLPEALVRNIVLTKLQAVGLRGAAELVPSELSGGMARRVALARAIVRDPMLLIYDEPFVGLDPIALNQVLKLIRTLNHTLGLTSILVAHELSAVSRVIETEWSSRGVHSTTLYYPLVATPMIAPTKAYDGLPALTPREAGQWMIDAARHRPVRIAPRIAVSARALDVVAPGVLNRMLKRQRMQPS